MSNITPISTNVSASLPTIVRNLDINNTLSLSDYRAKIDTYVSSLSQSDYETLLRRCDVRSRIADAMYHLAADNVVQRLTERQRDTNCITSDRELDNECLEIVNEAVQECFEHPSADDLRLYFQQLDTCYNVQCAVEDYLNDHYDQDKIDDVLWQLIDGNEHVIYYYKARMLCCYCSTYRGGEWLEECETDSKYSSFSDHCCKLAFAEMLYRCRELLSNKRDELQQELKTLIDDTL